MVAIIDDIIMRRQDSNDDGTFDQTWYHVTDTLFSTVAILDDAAKLVERVSYDAYGNARHHRAGDFTGDGATNNSDLNGVILANYGTYGAGDMNRDGIVNNTDLNMLLGDYGTALPAGRISSSNSGGGGADNIIGYAGYVFNAEIGGSGLYTVRFRHYEVDLGRWIERDPLGYVDGMGLHEYTASNPLAYVDASGLTIKSKILSACRRVKKGGITVSITSPPIPALGGSSLFGTATVSRVKRSDGKCCCRITAELGLTWNITRRISKAARKIPVIGDDVANAVNYVNVGASVGVSGTGVVCPDCWDACEWRVFGSIEAGRTPRFQKTDSFLHPNKSTFDITVGASGIISGNWNLCTGAASISVGGSFNIGGKARIRNPFSKWFKQGREWWDMSINYSGSLNDLNLFGGTMPALFPSVTPCT